LEENKEIRVINGEADLSEAALIAAARKGDKSAFGSLVKSHQKKVLRMVIGMVGDPDSAMDIVQESFVRAWQAMDRFEGGQPFQPWISRIASNLAINHIKRSGRLRSLDDEVIQRAINDPDPLQKMQLDENDRRFMQAVRELPAQYRLVFVLRTFENLSYEEIADRLDIASGTVDSRLYRARRMLVDKLKDLLD
jgi:RNA polymerase sigma factor (sigma-70 family)